MSDVINMESFKKRVTDTVIAQFGTLIPEEQFKSMVDKEISDFFENSSASFVIDSSAKCTPFRLMVWKELHKLVHDKFSKLIFQSAEFHVNQTWGQSNFENGAKLELSEMLEKRLVENIPKMMAEMMRNTFGTVVMDIKRQISEDMRKGL
jgi:hypothetical protein